MPEEPNLPDKPLSSDAASAFTDADWTEEWTDDSAYESLEGVQEDEVGTTASSLDEWDEAAIAWEDDVNDPPETTPQPTTTQEALTWIQPVWRRWLRLWQRLITGVRNRIPAAAQLSNAALSAILVGILVVLLVLLNSVRQPSAARSKAAVETPSPTGQDPSAAAPPAAPERAAQNPASPLTAVPAPVEAPAPAPLVSDRIAKIQAQMTDNSILNAQRVIDSVQADLVNNRLTLVFNGDWYRLSDYDQTQLAQALMAQSQALSFADLQLQTSEGAVIGRSPVIGDHMVILQRERPPQVPVPERPRFRLMVDR